MRLDRALTMTVASGAAMLAMAAPASASPDGAAVANEAAMAGMKNVCTVMMRDTPGMEHLREAMMRNPVMAEMCEKMMKDNQGMAQKCQSMMSGAMSQA